jgi:hypothetical protein
LGVTLRPFKERRRAGRNPSANPVNRASLFSSVRLSVVARRRIKREALSRKSINASKDIALRFIDFT